MKNSHPNQTVNQTITSEGFSRVKRKKLALPDLDPFQTEIDTVHQEEPTFPKFEHVEIDDFSIDLSTLINNADLLNQSATSRCEADTVVQTGRNTTDERR